jgi:hypothetical protein
LGAGGSVGGYGIADELQECGFVNGVAFVNIDGAADVAFKAGVEELVGVGKYGAACEGEFDGLLVRLAGADDAVA